MNLPSIYNIAQICASHAITHAILSPGSRCAPLVIGFSRHPSIDTKVIIDERSAAYIAMGIAQQTDKPCVLVCTSGTAAYNYAPAIAEAFYQEIPLLVLTADRPPEWIDQQDGQAIQQPDLYGKHVKKSYQLPVDTSCADAEWHFERVVSEAINLAQQEPKGPVHLNIPIREPFYPKAGETVEFKDSVKIIRCIKPEQTVPDTQWQALRDRINASRKVLVLAGQNVMTAGLKASLSRILQSSNFVLCGDILANLQGIDHSCRFVDGVLALQDEAEIAALKPDLLITFGLSVLSKNVKAFFKKCHVQEHWHIQSSPIAADTFQSLTTVVQLQPERFFETLANHITDHSVDSAYRERWQRLDALSLQAMTASLHSIAAFSELHIMNRLLSGIDRECILHLGNSMSVRYANLFRLRHHDIKVYCNRGTSGIDGSVSTSLGHALVSDKLNILIIGDVSVLYDRNAFWNKHIPDNFKVIVLNNRGGGIFKLIEGPGDLPELNDCFVADQTWDVSNIAKDAGLNYIKCDCADSLDKGLEYFFSPDTGRCILEIFSDSDVNTKAFQDYRKILKSQYENFRLKGYSL